jgi:uncharacterized protein involved in exopolysaccharide biosynthesis
VKTNPEATVRELIALKSLVAAAEVKVATLRSSMRDGSAQVNQALSQLASLRSQLARAEAGDRNGAGTDGTQYVERLRNYKYRETIFELMARQFELAKADEAREGAVIQVVDAVLPPERKSKPRRAVIALSVLALTLVGTAGYVLQRRRVAA